MSNRHILKKTLDQKHGIVYMGILCERCKHHQYTASYSIWLNEEEIKEARGKCEGMFEEKKKHFDSTIDCNEQIVAHTLSV